MKVGEPEKAMVWGEIRRAFLLLSLAAMAAVSACARSGPPAPVVYGEGGKGQRGVEEVPAVYVVQRGDTVYGISRRFDVPIRGIIDANALTPPYTLLIGQRLHIPQPPVHVVQRGDTVYGISRRYGVEMTELVRLNRITPPYTIRIGETLILPNQPAARVAAAPAPAPAPRTRIAENPVPPVPEVERQPLPQPPPVSGGEAPQDRSPAGAPLPPVKPRSGSSIGEPATPTSGVAVATVTPAQPPPRVKPASVALPTPPRRSNERFLWPVRGPILSSFGAKDGGLHNDGLNIGAPLGTPVVAAENGVVAYAGSELRGFGNLLLVKHSDGYVTAYAHNQMLLVGRGDLVRRGQTIARVGSTGSVRSPQLHFEIRRGSRAIDPRRLMSPLTAQRL